MPVGPDDPRSPRTWRWPGRVVVPCQQVRVLSTHVEVMPLGAGMASVQTLS